MRSTGRAAEGLARTEAEIRAEKAAALARIGRTLEGLLADLARRREQMAGRAGPERGRAAADYAALREQAALYRWYLVVQREALGLSRHDEVDRHYPLPEPL
jgi:hypothetical protein